MAPGLTAVIGGRPKPAPLLRFFSYLWPKNQIPLTIKTSDGHEEIYEEPLGPSPPISPTTDDASSPDSSESKARPVKIPKGSHSYQLSQLAWLRSGDKGNNCNIGVIARQASFYPFLQALLTSDQVMKYFRHKFTSGDEAPSCVR